MKKKIIILTLLCTALAGRAQDGDYRPMVVEGKMWRMLYHNEEANDLFPDYEFGYFIEGDTLIAANECKRLYAYNEDNRNDVVYKMALFEKDRIIYFIPYGSTKHYVLYDFNLQTDKMVVIDDANHPGEWIITMKADKQELFSLDGTDSIIYLVKRKSHDGSKNDYYYPGGWWIEGIGSELGLLNTWDFNAMGNNYYFLGCELYGKVIFNFSEFFSAQVGVGMVLQDHIDEGFFDLHGRRLAAPPAKGVYIQGGRKRVAP